MQQPLRLPVMTLGIGNMRPALRRALWLPALVLVLTVIVVVSLSDYYLGESVGEDTTSVVTYRG